MSSVKEEAIHMNGTIFKILKGDNFKVTVGLNGKNHVVDCKPSGKIRKFNISLTEGDRVKIEVSPYDLTKGRIVFREKV